VRASGLRRLFLVGVLLTGTAAFADLKDIRKEKLPADPVVQSAYSDVIAVEDMVKAWSQKWEYPTPKEEVVSRVNSSLSRLQNAAKISPENEELLLLIGLVAHYSYSLDVHESHEIAVASFEKSSKLVPGDLRPEWFLGNHLCQSGSSKEGMEKLLHVEEQTSWNQLPATYWDDYIACAGFANMPAHALWGIDCANKLDPQNSGRRQFLVDGSRKRCKGSDAATTYDFKDAWRANDAGSSRRLTSYVLGMQLVLPATAKFRLSNVRNGEGGAMIAVGPYAGKAGQVTPNVTIMVRPPKPGETLSDFLKAAMPGVSLKAVSVPLCPVSECLAAEGIMPNAYHAEGDAHGIVVVFQRDPPPYPGLAFEEPVGFPKSEEGGMHFYHAEERLHRLPGTLYYMVMLDTADSVLVQAQQGYASILKILQVE
jgi:hypothetical protein